MIEVISGNTVENVVLLLIGILSYQRNLPITKEAVHYFNM